MLQRSVALLRKPPKGRYRHPISEAHRMTKTRNFDSWYTKGSMKGGVPRIHYGWMAPGSLSRRRFEKKQNPFVDLETGQNLYYRDARDNVEAMRMEAESQGGAPGVGGGVAAQDLFNESRIVPDLYPEGFQWKHKLNSEYNQWRSNTWVAPELIPVEHRGRFLCNFQINIVEYNMRVAKFSPKDHRQWIFCLLYIGTGKGIAGWGRSVAPSSAEAKKDAIKCAFENITAVNLENEGPLFPVRINHDGVRAMMYPAKKLVCNFMAADICCAFGLIRAGIKLGERGVSKPYSRARHVGATFELISMMKTATEVAHARGKIASSLIHNIYPYLEEVRRRKGMLAMHPSGKDGMFYPDRVVDNRLPDHLKQGYYDDHYWKDFFAGSGVGMSGGATWGAPQGFGSTDGSKGGSNGGSLMDAARGVGLNEPRLGMRADELRSMVPANRALTPTAASPAITQRNFQQLAPSNKGSVGAGRRTLADVLARMGRPVSSLGPINVVNPFDHKPLPAHQKATFHLHK